jgi:PAS domain S-box-containing protein
VLRRPLEPEVFVYVTVVPRSEQENGAIAVVSNLTQRKLMEGALRESEERFRRLSAATVEGIVIHDSGQILDANESAARMFGYDAEEMIGLGAIELVAREAREAMLSNMHSGHDRRYEGTGLRKDGSTFPVEIQGSAVSYSDRTVRVTALRDISERKRTEAALQQSEQRYKQLVENASDIIYRVNLRGELTYVNPVAVRMMGYSEDELLGMQYTRLLRPDQREEAQEFYATQVVEQLATTYWEFAAITREGRELWLGQHVQLVMEGGRVAGLQAMARDITGQREVERIKDEFISVVSHELRTPLTSIRGSLGLLASGRMGELPERGQRLLDIAAQNTDRLVRLINDILDLERLQSGRVALEKQDCDAADLMAQAVEVVRAAAEGAGVTLSCQPRSALLHADPDRIVQVLVNLLGNAIKFSPAGAIVRIEGERRNGEFRFQVRDRGRGIPVDKLESIFGRFQQVDSSDSRQKGGTGLGLAICRSIVEQHDGRIWAESMPADGSTFVFTLPTPHAHPSATDSQRGAARVLLAEDDPDLARVLMETLERDGIEVHHAVTGLDTVRLAVQIRPDLLVLDLILPDGDGFAVVAQLQDHEALRHLPIVVYSARQVEPAERERLRLGPTEFLTKARVTPDQLEERVLSLLRERDTGANPLGSSR